MIKKDNLLSRSARSLNLNYIRLDYLPIAAFDPCMEQESHPFSPLVHNVVHGKIKRCEVCRCDNSALLRWRWEEVGTESCLEDWLMRDGGYLYPPSKLHSTKDRSLTPNTVYLDPHNVLEPVVVMLKLSEPNP